MAMIYVQIFANSCNNSSVDKNTEATGKISWKSKIFAEEGNDNTAYLLSADQKIFVVSNKSIIAFNSEGKLLWKRNRYPFTPVSMRFNKIYFISGEQYSRMCTIDFNNNIVTDDFWIPELVGKSYLTLFEPVEKGLIAQVQYSPDPDEGEMGFVLYRIHSDGLGTEWQKNFDGQKSKIIPVVLPEKNLLITSNTTGVFEFNLDNTAQVPPVVNEFPLPLGENTLWLSADGNGNLYWLGNESENTLLKTTNLKGEDIWEWKSGPSDFQSESVPLSPAVTGNKQVFVLTENKIYSIKDGTLLWQLDSGESSFLHITVLNDDSILVTKLNSILLFDANGEEIFEVSISEKLITAAVVDENGKIYAAGADYLYCIE